MRHNVISINSLNATERVAKCKYFNKEIANPRQASDQPTSSRPPAHQTQQPVDPTDSFPSRVSVQFSRFSVNLFRHKESGKVFVLPVGVCVARECLCMSVLSRTHTLQHRSPRPCRSRSEPSTSSRSQAKVSGEEFKLEK